MRRYRIAFLGLKGIPATSGADRVVECLVEDLSRSYDLSVYCKKGYVENGRPYKNVNRIVIPTIPVKHLDMFLYFLLSAFHACFIRRFNLVHVHNIDCAYILPLLRMVYRSRIISTSHGSPYEREKWSPAVKDFFRYLEGKFMRYSPTITSVASPLKSYYERQYGTFVEYIPNGVEFDGQEKPPLSDDAADQGVTDSDYILFAAGRILPSKGCHIFLEAIAKLQYPGHVLVIGDLSQMPEYSARLRSLATPATRFLGFITSKNVLMNYVKRSKLFVFPSTYEAASMMLLESVSTGVPSIISNIPENKTLLDDPNAMFFESGNADDLGQKINMVLDDYDRALVRARRLQHYIRHAYSWSGISRSYMNLYKRALLDN